MSSTQNEDVLYALDPEKVLVGDVVLTTSDKWASWTARTKSWTIRTVTRSPFSHAAICTRHDMLVEAQSTGVTRALVSMTRSPTLENLAVLRLKPNLSAVNDFGLQVADYAESYYGRSYSLKGALASPFPGDGPDAGAALFCSQLVVDAYRAVGVELLPGLEPNKVVPGALTSSEALEDVTQSVVRVVRRSDSPLEYLTLVDGPAMGIPHKEMAMNRGVLARVAYEMKRLGLPEPDSLVHALWFLEGLVRSGDSGRARELDHCVLQAFAAEGFLVWYEAHDASLRASLDELKKLKEFVGKNEVPREQRQEIAVVLRQAIGDRNSIDTRRATFEETQSRAASTNLETFKVLAEVYYRQWQAEMHRQAVVAEVISALET